MTVLQVLSTKYRHTNWSFQKIKIYYYMIMFREVIVLSEDENNYVIVLDDSSFWTIKNYIVRLMILVLVGWHGSFIIVV